MTTPPRARAAVLYRWRLRPGTEATFREAWRTLTDAIRVQRGGLGSRLHRGEDGTWWAYAQWPSRERWDEAQALPAVDEAASQALRACVAETFPPVHLNVEDDLWQAR